MRRRALRRRALRRGALRRGALRRGRGWGSRWRFGGRRFDGARRLCLDLRHGRVRRRCRGCRRDGFDDRRSGGLGNRRDRRFDRLLRLRRWLDDAGGYRLWWRCLLRRLLNRCFGFHGSLDLRLWHRNRRRYDRIGVRLGERRRNSSSKRCEGDYDSRRQDGDNASRRADFKRCTHLCIDSSCLEQRGGLLHHCCHAQPSPPTLGLVQQLPRFC